MTKRLRQEIEPQGVISFARFMELALYDEPHGYYQRQPNVIGTGGDFYTSPSTGPLFGELLARQLAEWLDELGGGTLQLVEAGAHHGQLAADILGWLRHHRADLFPRVDYWIFESSTRRQKWQASRLSAFSDRVRWFSNFSPSAAGAIRGIVFANELLDAMPVRRFGWEATGRRWFEWGVGWHDPHFVWRKMPVADQDGVGSLFRKAGFVMPDALPQVLPHGFTLEVSPQAGAWWREAAQALRAGRLMTLDYGLSAEEFLEPHRAQGTLRAYRAHQLCPDPLAHPGEQDLTAHVNWTQLQQGGTSAGLATERLVTQAQFLTAIAAKAWAASSANETWSAAQIRQFQTLTHPDHLGRAFQVLVQRRPD